MSGVLNCKREQIHPHAFSMKLSEPSEWEEHKYLNA